LETKFQSTLGYPTSKQMRLRRSSLYMFCSPSGKLGHFGRDSFCSVGNTYLVHLTLRSRIETMYSAGNNSQTKITFVYDGVFCPKILWARTSLSESVDVHSRSDL